MVYNDGSSQNIKPTLLFPDIFIKVGLEFEGVEKIVFNSNGSFYVLHQGKGYIIVPSFENIEIIPTEKSLEPSIVVNTDGTLTYTVAVTIQNVQSQETTHEAMVFKPLIKPAPNGGSPE